MFRLLRRKGFQGQLSQLVGAILGYGISAILVRHDEDSSVQEPDAHSNQGLLPKCTRHDWKQMSRRFRKLYIGTTGSYLEMYFTMTMTDHETRLQFFYRLNAAAVKAEVKFKSSSKLRESHIRRFIKKLRNDQLKTALEGYMFQSIADLERALRRHEDV
ncbi:hypothetical protein PHMEG_00032029 [Phytophthora megakarya]|uniref:Uncharacterized protein n=1 Tax=Phytophthora megakarya TaxID=4795 RepID=A0A225UVJ2_9STRA|nr:hypothetical protein PHMEG_00032029 [Phytophthora megakarya]